MKKLLHISPNVYPKLDQENHHTKKIWQELSLGFDEYHILARSKTNHFSYSSEGNIHLHLVPKITNKSKVFFFTSLYLFKLVQKYKITHLLSQCSILGGFWATIASKWFKIPIMIEIHGEEYFRLLHTKHYISKIIQFSFNNCNKLRSLNSAMTNKLFKFGFDKNIVEIPNRVNLKLFDSPKSNFEIKNKIQLISVGRFVKEKNYLKLMEILHQSNLNFTLTLIGGGKLKNEYEVFIETNNLHTKVVLIDWVDQNQLISLINQSDIYIQYSISEGMPRTILEAMALRMPIISTNVGSIEGVLNKKNSLIINVNNKEELIAGINALVHNQDKRETMANNAYSDIVELYEWDKVFNKYRKEIVEMNYENS